MQSSGDVKGAALDTSVALDRRFDMRDDPTMYVSDVRYQSPWGTCWAFGPTAAAESAIYADTGQKVDLSERHLAWFAHTPIAQADDPTQVGEGIYPYKASGQPNLRFNGGWWYEVSTAYASGVGPVLESAWPYHGKDSLTELEVLRLMPEAWKLGYWQYKLADRSSAEIDALLKEEGCKTIDEYLETVYQATRIAVGPNTQNHYSPVDDWSIPERDAEGRSVRNQSAGFLAKDVNAMPSACHVDPQTKRPTLDKETMAAVKQELRRGHAVAITYAVASPSSTPGRPSFIRNGTYAQYTWKEVEGDHTVCIVGWDDDYPVTNFNQGTTTEGKGEGSVTYDMTPPGPGAWIVKNSWGNGDGTGIKRGGPLGADLTQVFGNSGWGAAGSGYFYLSYYDQSLSEFVSYSFLKDVPPQGMVFHQYDYLCSRPQYEILDSAEMSVANVFDVRQYEALTSVGATTSGNAYNIRMDYAIYKLREGATSPVDGELLDTISCLYAYPGYHREPLDEPIPLAAGERLSVVVTQTRMGLDGKTEYVICASSADSEAGGRRSESDEYGKAVVNRGESWAFVGGRWQDWTDVLAADPRLKLNERAVDNVGIKAFARVAEAGTYRWTAGGRQSWTKGTAAGLAFTLERTERPEDTAAHVTGVSVDARRLSEGDYTLSRSQDGATVTLTAGLLEGLAVGSHELEVTLDDAQALEMPFAVEEGRVGPEPQPGPGPDPGRPFPDDGDVRYDGEGRLVTTWHEGHDATGWPDGSDATSTMPESPSGSSSAVTRVAGTDRYQTMAAVVSGAFASSEVCVVASGTAYPDALSAAGLAGALRAPVVLTAPGELSREAAAEIARLGVRRALLMGGEAALSPAVADAVAALGVDVSRVAGADRVSTSVEAMRRARAAGSNSDTVLVASGTGFADALAAGPWAWAKAAPVLLCGADGLLSPEALAEISSDGRVTRVVVLGGPAAVGDVASQLPDGITCERVGGADRYQTARLVAERAAAEGLSFASTYVTSGTSLADALAAGPAAGARGDVLLLADPSGATLATTLRAHRGQLGSVVAVGGEAAVGPAAFDAARDALG